MLPRVCIFIDGENFRNTISELFPSQYSNHDYLPPSSNWTNFINLVIDESAKSLGYVDRREVHFSRCYWFVINELQYSTRFLSDEFNSWSLHNKYKFLKPIAKSVIGNPNETNNSQVGAAVDRARRHLETQHQKIQERLRGWKEIQHEIERETPKLQFQRFGHVSVDLDKFKMKSEKGVDVKLATDMILLKDIYDIAILVSGDADYIPAISAIKNFGKTTVAVDFLTNTGDTLPGGAKKLKYVCDDCISLEFNALKTIFGY